MIASDVQVADMEWFNPFDQGYIHDPLPAVTRIHATAPVFRYKPLDIWFISKYSDVKKIQRDADTFSNKVFGWLPPPADLATKVQVFTDHEMLVGMDPPEHTTLRKPLVRAFTPTLISTMEESVRQKANELIDGFIAEGQGELMSLFNYPLALSTIVNVFGMPLEDSALLRGWSDDFMKMITFRRSSDNEVQNLQMPAEEVRMRWTNILEARQYFEEYVARLRSVPEETVFSDLLALRKLDGANQISDETAILNFPNLIAAGHDTTANLIGQTLRLLSENPDQLELLLEDMSLLPQAVEETMRMRPSAIGSLRISKAPAVFRGVEIPAGSFVLLMLNAAGLDAEQFENPGKFDLKRSNSSQQLAFGNGLHNCPGTQLAKMQARVAIGELLKRIPTVRLSSHRPVTYSPSLPLRLATSIPVEW